MTTLYKDLASEVLVEFDNKLKNDLMDILDSIIEEYKDQIIAQFNSNKIENEIFAALKTQEDKDKAIKSSIYQYIGSILSKYMSLLMQDEAYKIAIQINKQDLNNACDLALSSLMMVKMPPPPKNEMN